MQKPNFKNTYTDSINKSKSINKIIAKANKQTNNKTKFQSPNK